MARYVPGMLGAISGSIGSYTLSKNASGYYIKQKAIPTQPNTAAQLIVRALMATAVSTWQNFLSSANRQAWAQAADLHKRSAMGFGFTMSGYNLFIACFIAASKIGVATPVAPTIFEGAPPIIEPTIGDDAGGLKEVTAWGDPNPQRRLIVRSSSAFNQGVNYRAGAFKEYDAFDSGFVGNQGIGRDYPGAAQVYALFYSLRVFDLRGAISGELESRLTGTVI